MKPVSENYTSINRAALQIDVSSQTIRRWYKWWEDPKSKKPEGLELPLYYYLDRRKTKYFKNADIPMLVAFTEALQTTHKGSMAEFNAHYQWGQRGAEILSKRGNKIKKLF